MDEEQIQETEERGQPLDETDKTILHMYQELKMTMKEIGESVNLHESSVSRRLQKMGINVKSGILKIDKTKGGDLQKAIAEMTRVRSVPSLSEKGIKPVKDGDIARFYRTLKIDADNLAALSKIMGKWLMEYKRSNKKHTGGENDYCSEIDRDNQTFIKAIDRMAKISLEHKEVIIAIDALANNLYEKDITIKWLKTFKNIVQRSLSKDDFKKLIDQVAMECGTPEVIK